MSEFPKSPWWTLCHLRMPTFSQELLVEHRSNSSILRTLCPVRTPVCLYTLCQASFGDRRPGFLFFPRLLVVKCTWENYARVSPPSRTARRRGDRSALRKRSPRPTGEQTKCELRGTRTSPSRHRAPEAAVLPTSSREGQLPRLPRRARSAVPGRRAWRPRRRGSSWWSAGASRGSLVRSR